ncbi:DUF6346 domain-containing protein [Amycolatopsis pittospori]|uniref:DUF6346 domain-containing protein n=1 Tax=Amycolatopsis pittospori TaxID=2749434 RepID=UPI0015F01323|nr:DUF6346 domain-containing protein [Amycolatopsis pittospori]
MNKVVLATGYEAVPTVKRKSLWKVAGATGVFALYALISWTLIGRGIVADGEEGTSKFVDMATAKTCDEIGPLSFAGIGYYWVCEIEVRPYSSGSKQEVAMARSFPGELSPADIGKPVRVKEFGRYYARDFKSDVPWWSIAPAVGGLVGLGLFAYRRQVKRFREPPSGRPVVTALSLSPVRTTGSAVAPVGLPATASRTVTPHEWSSAKFWRICGLILAVGAVFGIVGFTAERGTELREATLTLAAIGLLSPGWLWFCTPARLGRSTWRTTFTVSAEGIRWFRRDKATFEVRWEDIRELRLTTITDGKRTLRLIDFFPADDEFPKRRRELSGLWEIGATLDGRSLPPVGNGYRLPEAFSDAAFAQVRRAMVLIRPDKLSEYRGIVQGG